LVNHGAVDIIEFLSGFLVLDVPGGSTTDAEDDGDAGDDDADGGTTSFSLFEGSFFSLEGSFFSLKGSIFFKKSCCMGFASSVILVCGLSAIIFLFFGFSGDNSEVSFDNFGFSLDNSL